MSLYNTTNLTGARDLYQQAKAMNDIVDGSVGYSIMLIAFTIPFVILYNRTGDATAALGGASFFLALTASIMLPLGMIAPWIFNITVLMCASGILISLWTGARR